MLSERPCQVASSSRRNLVEQRLLVTNVQDIAPQTDARLINPVDVAVQGGMIWVSVPANNLVLRYNKHCNGTATAISVTSPTGLAIHNKHLYIASRGGSVFSVETGSSSTTAQNYVTIGGSLEGIAWHKNVMYVSVSDRGYVAAVKDGVPVRSIVNRPLFTFDYGPRGLRVLDGNLYITYSDMSTSVGSGYVGVYDIKHGTLHNLIIRDALAHPYGLAMKDEMLLVGNRGTGLLETYSLRDDESKRERIGNVNDGLMGMSLCGDELYWVAANDNGAMGSLGVMYLR